MIYTWNQLGVSAITNLYLYGTTAKPANLESDALIRGPLPTLQSPGITTSIDMDAVSFMATGPGRFANGTQLSVVARFMDGTGVPTATSVRQVYTLSTMMSMTGGSDRVGIQQYNYSDGVGDHAFRTYVYNSSGFRLAPEAVFVIEPDGSRHVENFAILPFDDNFDFFSGDDLATFGNPWLQARIDPSRIGRRVEIESKRPGCEVEEVEASVPTRNGEAGGSIDG